MFQYPCNICAYVDEVRTACLPISAAGYDPPATCPEASADGAQCAGHACPQMHTLNPGPIGATCGLSHGVSCTIQNLPSNQLKMRTLLAPVSQASLPEEKRWLCDRADKIGCFDLCTYDPGDPTAAEVTASAVDNASLGGRCDGPGVIRPVPCAGGGDCDDHNPARPRPARVAPVLTATSTVGRVTTASTATAPITAKADSASRPA